MNGVTRWEAVLNNGLQVKIVRWKVKIPPTRGKTGKDPGAPFTTRFDTWQIPGNRNFVARRIGWEGLKRNA